MPRPILIDGKGEREKKREPNRPNGRPISNSSAPGGAGGGRGRTKKKKKKKKLFLKKERKASD